MRPGMVLIRTQKKEVTGHQSATSYKEKKLIKKKCVKYVCVLYMYYTNTKRHNTQAKRQQSYISLLPSGYCNLSAFFSVQSKMAISMHCLE